MDDRENILKSVKQEVLNCQKCSLFKTRTYPVIGQGNHYAKIVFVGEAPGANEDKTGRPFCGTAGKILDNLLKSVNIKREDVYISNLLKCRPPQNRDPLKQEIESCFPYLEKQIQAIKPKIICPLGRFSMQFIMQKFELKKEIQSISKIHGKVFEAKSLFDKILIIPFYHPAVVAYNINMRPVLEQDFKVLKKIKE